MQNEFKKTTVPIKGMHCKSCEILIEKNLRKIEGVHNVKSSFKQGKAEITHTDDVYEDQIAQAIKDAGYTIGIEKLNWFSQNSKDYKDILIASAGIMALYFFLQAAGVFNFAPDMSGSVGLMTPLLVGLVAGFSTCMALVGGLVLGISARYSELHPDYTSAQKFTPHLMFNLGRVLGFALLGGLIGAVFKVSPAVLAFLTVAVGLVMLLMGVKLTELFPKLNSISLTLPVSLAKALGINKEHGSNKLAFLSGVLTFFLPCGFTQAMQLYAISTGNFAMGAMVMGLFALGTTPGLLSIGGLSSFMKGQAAKMFFKMAGIVVVLLGIFNIQNGWYVLANSFGAAPSTIAVAEGEQVITMTESSYGYEPNDFTLKQNVPVKWIINARDVYSCASTVIIPKLGVSQTLVKGENIVKFIPTELGDLPFSCSMGMYRGMFHIVPNKDAKPDSALVPTAIAQGTPPSLGGGCGMMAGKTGGCGGGCGAKANAVPTVGTIEPALPADDTQVIKTAYTAYDDIQPNAFTVQSGKPVRMEIDVKEDGIGCMSSIKIPGLYETPQLLEAGKLLTMEFVPTQKGNFSITCAMGMPRGNIIVE